jgi:hypothetical protein
LGHGGRKIEREGNRKIGKPGKKDERESFYAFPISLFSGF